MTGKKRKIHTNSMFFGGTVFWKKKLQIWPQTFNYRGKTKKNGEIIGQLGVGCVFFKTQIYNKKKSASWVKKSGQKCFLCEKSHPNCEGFGRPVQDMSNLSSNQTSCRKIPFKSLKKHHLVSLIAPFFNYNKKNLWLTCLPTTEKYHLKKN